MRLRTNNISLHHTMNLAACTLFALACLAIPAAHAARTLRHRDREETPMCASMTTTKLFNTSVPTCLRFHSSDVAIVMPEDTPTLQYGTLKQFGSGYTFTDREDGRVTVPSSLVPPEFIDYFSDTQSLSQMLFKISLNEWSSVSAVELVLLIDQTAMIAPFSGSVFTGTIVNRAPLPDGILPLQWFKWEIGDAFVPLERVPDRPESTVMALEGNFSNLYADAFDPVAGVCRPALIVDEATSEWYTHAVGNGTQMYFYWYPDMHGPLDSEFVPFFSNRVSYMASLPTPSQLLASNIDTTKEYDFVVHGTPIGVLMLFKGTFSSKGNDTPVDCGVRID